MKPFIATSIIICALGARTSGAEGLRLPRIFSDSMVLQSGQAVPIWGTAQPKATVTVEFADQIKKATADASGKWRINFDPLEATSIGQHLSISSSGESMAFADVVVGEVWFCSGQSNMDLPLSFLSGKAMEAQYQGIADQLKMEMQTANDPLLRQFAVTHQVSPFNKSENLAGAWVKSSPSNNGQFSGTAYYFGRELRRSLKVPVGLIKCAYSGTSIQPWIPKSAYVNRPEIKRSYTASMNLLKIQSAAWDQEKVDAEHEAKYRAWVAAGKQGMWPVKPQAPQDSPLLPATLFNGMVNPLIPYGIKGVIWYQGETNAMISATGYSLLFEAMVSAWREAWNKPDLPFYYAQLASHETDFKHWIGICDIQRRLLHIKHTGMAILIDIGEARDIHPKNKIDVGKRLALWALKNDHSKDVVCSGPIYSSHRAADGSVVVTFDHADSGLMVARKNLLNPASEIDAPLQLFEVAAARGQWHAAQAEIVEGGRIRVWSDKVPAPSRVRYAWTTNPTGALLYNRAGLPASLFTSDQDY